MKHVWLALPVIPLILFSGCSPSSYSIRVIDGAPKEVYLTFSKGTDVKVGDVFLLYRMQPPPENGGGHSHHGGGGQLNLKQEVGRVHVVSIADETHALVKVLSGYAENGLNAEKVE